MQFRSTRSHQYSSPHPLPPAPPPGDEASVSFKEAVHICLPRDGGLYVPASMVDLRQFFLYMNEDTTYPELVSAVTPALLQEGINPLAAARVAESAGVFEPELRQLDDRFSLLNLYNGPSGVFKDFGIAFLAAVLEEMLKDGGQAVVLSAVRGDTGASLAQAFRDRQGIISVMLYPSGRPIRGLDEASFINAGGNIIPIQIRGTFDDCQRLVAEAIHDRDFSEGYHITSANAINPGRLLPQAFYFLYAFIKVKKRIRGDLVFSVPAGNFGNLMAGLYAWKAGMPVNGFIAAMNANDAFGDFIRGKGFTPKPLISTCSPALDVRFPSNYERLLSFYEESPAVMRTMVYPASINDEVTMREMEQVWQRYQVLIDPHTAVAFAAAEQLAESPEYKGHIHVVVLATGHPAKEPVLVQEATGQYITLPEKLKALRKKTDPIALIDPQLAALEGAIASCL